MLRQRDERPQSVPRQVRRVVLFWSHISVSHRKGGRREGALTKLSSALFHHLMSSASTLTQRFFHVSTSPSLPGPPLAVPLVGPLWTWTTQRSDWKRGRR